MVKENSALVILSGGQDSTTCLFLAKKKFTNIEAITFDYGQRHRRELDCAKKLAELTGIKHKLVTIESLSQLTDNAMMSDKEIKLNEANGLPTTFVPGRNLIFVTFAAAYAYERQIPNLILGVSQVDYSGYPDCRRETIESLQQTISLGMEFPFKIHTPLVDKNKYQTVMLAQEVGALDYMQFTHTCYKGQFPPCGECPACQLRAKGFAQASLADPLLN